MFIHKEISGTDQQRKQQETRKRHALELKDDSDDELVVQDFDHAPSSDTSDSKRDARAQRGLDHLEAAQIDFLAAAQAGDTTSMVKLGQLFMLQNEPHRAVPWFEKASELGDAEGQYTFGICHVLGQGVPVDEGKAASLYEAAAAQGQELSSVELGRLLASQGHHREAMKHYVKEILRAPQGAPQARFRMASHLDESSGQEKRAFRHFLVGAKAGQRECQYHVGLGYRYKDATRAEKWFRRAAAQGHVGAMYKIGDMYFGSKALPDAKEWFPTGTTPTQ